MILSGIDEAGLGPLLGPYCAALVSLSYGGELRDPRKMCYTTLRPDPAPGKLAVGDSKKIYSPGKLLQLERTALAFLGLSFGEEFTQAETLLKKLLPGEENREIFHGSAPWNRVIRRQKLPLEADPAELRGVREKLSRQFEKKGLALKRLDAVVVPPGRFNRLLGESRNKAAACQTILAPLLQAGCSPGGRLIVDRQGGRRYYGEWLVELFPGRRLNARQETAQLSLYDVGGAEVAFQVGADALCFETALASMIAKYLRELYMRGFNRYWHSVAPAVKGTAGYHSDGRRFIRDLEDAGLLPEDLSGLVRRK